MYAAERNVYMCAHVYSCACASIIHLWGTCSNSLHKHMLTHTTHTHIQFSRKTKQLNIFAPSSV